MTKNISLIDVKKKTGQVRKKIDREWLFKSPDDKLNQNVKDEAIQKEIIFVSPEKNAENDSTKDVVIQEEKRYNKPNFLGKLFGIFSRNQVTDTLDKEKGGVRNDPVYTGDDNNDKKDLVNIDDNEIKKKKKKPKPIVIEPVKAGMKKEKKILFIFLFIA